MGPIIDLTTLFSWKILMIFSYSIAFFNIYRTVLKDKFHPLLTFLAVFFASMVACVVFFKNAQLNPIGYLAFAMFCFIIILLMTNGKMNDKILAVIISLISQLTAIAINAIVAMWVLNGKYYKEPLDSNNMNSAYLPLYLFNCIVFVIVAILFSEFLKLYKNRHSNNKTSKLLMLICVFLFTNMLLISFSFLIVSIEYHENYVKNQIYIAAYILFFITLIFDCCFPIIINHIEKIIERNKNNEKNIIKNTIDYNQLMMMKKEREEFRKIKHDFANIIATAKGFIEINKPEKALNILSHTSDDLMGISCFCVCSNETINTVLYIKQQQAEKNNIALDIEINENYPIVIDDYDLCRLLHNIMDNSLNAVSLLDDNRRCRIFIESDNDLLTIICENKYIENKNKVKNKLSNDHGHGINIIKSIVSKYGGKCAFKPLNSTWHTEVLLRNEKAQIAPPPHFSADFIACFSLPILHLHCFVSLFKKQMLIHKFKRQSKTIGLTLLKLFFFINLGKEFLTQ